MLSQKVQAAFLYLDYFFKDGLTLIDCICLCIFYEMNGHLCDLCTLFIEAGERTPISWMKGTAVLKVRYNFFPKLLQW